MSDSLKAEFRKELKAHGNRVTHQDYAVVIDFNLPVCSRRLWLLDLKNDEILLNTHVSHALQSGYFYAKKLSNVPQSYKSSAGSFVTKNDYHGKFGYSMRIEGLEPQNSNVRKRTIVFHPMTRIKYGNYTLPSWFAIYSMGCFAPRTEAMNLIIGKTKNSRFVFVKEYLD